MFENKKVMARNILHYMEVNNVTATDVCKACGFKQNTFSDWVNAKTYPRIDKIELMANYFHINKAYLVEDVIFRESIASGHTPTEALRAFPPEYNFDDGLNEESKEFAHLFQEASEDDRALVMRFLKKKESKS
jgi:transcriptional regulator with XRE-family HTH domain